MKKMIIICFTLILVVTGGCSMNDKQNSKEDNKTEAVKPIDMDPKDLPKVPAFQDEKTREYMASTKEVEPGYYLLESKLKGFTMLFPEDGEVSSYLSKEGKNKEIIVFDSYDSKDGVSLNAQIEYYSKDNFISDSDTTLDRVRSQNSYTGDFEKIKGKGKDIYFAFKKRTFENKKSYGYFGYIKSIKSKEKNQLGIVYSLIFRCPDDPNLNSLNESDSRNISKKLIKSITFLIDKKEK
ncbi:lipoprotein YvcA [Bacillus sp. WMMC1349]|uniref:lipoprotein YvcA n=1 Tax=Bacillus sp. WMMC1349 TaxID=2736254 RepID=UPI001558014C|nr:lipoprotein YvcA [Bacillus sp. WMMC1349]NPC94585.1 lipoprotein YvcA [Bacillus sp. WMMC1349]